MSNDEMNDEAEAKSAAGLAEHTARILCIVRELHHRRLEEAEDHYLKRIKEIEGESPGLTQITEHGEIRECEGARTFLWKGVPIVRVRPPALEDNHIVSKLDLFEHEGSGK